MTAARHTWYMIMRQGRNLMREPIWIALLLIQPIIWLVLYGQLFKRVVNLGGFGTASYVTFLAPAIVVMNAFFGGTWSGMGMIFDLERKVVERFLATPASRLSLVLSQIVRAAITSGIQALVILVIALALGVHVHEGALGWLVVVLAAMVVCGTQAPTAETLKPLDGVMPAGSYALYSVSQGWPKVSVRSAGGSEAVYCELP